MLTGDPTDYPGVHLGCPGSLSTGKALIQVVAPPKNPGKSHFSWLRLSLEYFEGEGIHEPEEDSGACQERRGDEVPGVSRGVSAAEIL